MYKGVNRGLAIFFSLVFLFSTAAVLTACGEKDEEAAKSENQTEGEANQLEVDNNQTADNGDDFVGEVPEPLGQDADGNNIMQAINFSLADQNGARYTMEELKGKTVVINFWQSWCGPCKQEMPDFQKAYEHYGSNKEDVIILGVQTPKNEKNTRYAQESKNVQEIAAFLKDKNYTYPTLMDMTGDLFYNYQIAAFPTTFFVNPEGYVFGHVPGMLSYDTLIELIEKCKVYQPEVEAAN